MRAQLFLTFPQARATIRGRPKALRAHPTEGRRDGRGDGGFYREQNRKKGAGGPAPLDDGARGWKAGGKTAPLATFRPLWNPQPVTALLLYHVRAAMLSRGRENFFAGWEAGGFGP